MAMSNEALDWLASDLLMVAAMAEMAAAGRRVRERFGRMMAFVGSQSERVTERNDTGTDTGGEADGQDA